MTIISSSLLSASKAFLCLEVILIYADMVFWVSSLKGSIQISGFSNIRLIHSYSSILMDCGISSSTPEITRVMPLQYLIRLSIGNSFFHKHSRLKAKTKVR